MTGVLALIDAAHALRLGLPTGRAAHPRRTLRGRRGWSARQLAEAMTASGVTTTRSTLASLETGRRTHVSVDELWALSTALGVPPEQLADELCKTCVGAPPQGFSCNDCGRGAP